MDAHIFVNPGHFLTLDNSIITGCEAMWRGIRVENESGITLEIGSIIADARHGLFMTQNADYFRIRNSSIIDCIKEIFVEPRDSNGYSHMTCEVYGSQFGKRSSNFKADYPGQPKHGILAATNIEIHDMVNVVIGDDNLMPNYFFRANRGITVVGSNVTVTNGEFEGISRDTFYHWGFDGYALVACEDTVYNKSSKLYVFPLADASNPPTIHDGYRGVYSRHSLLEVRGLYMSGIVGGTMSEYSTQGNAVTIMNNKIEASRSGIRWRFNAGANLMWAQQNEIILSGDTTGTGISLVESTMGFSNYNVLENIITLNDSRYGIRSSGVKRPQISENIIKGNRSSNPIKKDGIVVTGCDSALVSCNVVSAYDETDTLIRGYCVNISDNSTISCNSSDSTGWCFYFRGICPGTDFKANIITNHYDGLRLSGSAVIDRQLLKGNSWNGTYGSGYGAVNLNSASAFNVGLNRFEINDSVIGTIYHPVNYIDPTCSLCQWFVYAPGNQDTCSGSDACIESDEESEGGDASEMEMKIAQDSVSTAEFEPESKSMSKQYLYDRATDIDSLRIKEPIIADFYDNLIGTENDYLKKINDKFSELTKYSAAYLSTVHQADSIIDTLSILFNYNMQLIIAGNGNNSLLQQNVQTMQQINQNLEIIDSLFQINEAKKEALFDSIGYFNNLVQPTDIITTNLKVVNELGLIIEQGIELNASQIEELRLIAIQCPNSGGKAVYRARPYFELYNDSAQYDDDYICDQLGNFRQSQSNSSGINKSTCYIKPNPASENATLVYNVNGYENLQFQVTDLTGRILFIDNLNEKESEYRFSTHSLSPGFYLYKIVDDTTIINKGKFAIMK